MANYILYAANDSQKTAGGYAACIIANDTSSTNAIIVANSTAPNDLGNPAPIKTWSAFQISSSAAADISSTVWFQGVVASPLVKARGV